MAGILMQVVLQNNKNEYISRIWMNFTAYTSYTTTAFLQHKHLKANDIIWYSINYENRIIYKCMYE